MNYKLRSFLQRIVDAAPIFPDPDDILEDTAMEIDISWNDILAAKAALADALDPPEKK